MQSNISNTTNYLIPAAGQTHCVTIEENLSPSPLLIDWRQFQIDNFPFRPQGVFVDNTAGIADLVILVKPLMYRVVCAAGTEGQYQFPAPDGQTCEITGNGAAKMYFVDFPVLPTAQNLKISGVTNINISSIDAGVSVNGKILPGEIEHKYGSDVQTVTLTPTTYTRLRKLWICLEHDCATAAAVTLTATVRGVTMYQKTLPQLVASTSKAEDKEIFIDFDVIAPDAGPGNLTVSLSAALTAGTLQVNSWWGQ